MGDAVPVAFLEKIFTKTELRSMTRPQRRDVLTRTEVRHKEMVLESLGIQAHLKHEEEIDELLKTHVRCARRATGERHDWGGPKRLGGRSVAGTTAICYHRVCCKVWV